MAKVVMFYDGGYDVVDEQDLSDMDIADMFISAPKPHHHAWEAPLPWYYKGCFGPPTLGDTELPF